MKKIHSWKHLVLLSLSVLFVLTSCTPHKIPPTETPYSKTTLVEQSASYLAVSDNELVEKSDIILLGKVVKISPTRWNQDDGSAWDNSGMTIAALQFHEIEVKVLRKVVDTINIGDSLIVTVIGPSPIDVHSDYSLKENDQVVMYVKQGKIAWREVGMKKAFLFNGSPYQSLYVQSPDGRFGRRSEKTSVSLEELIGKVKALRPILPEP
jgi:hypothetical protein